MPLRNTTAETGDAAEMELLAHIPIARTLRLLLGALLRAQERVKIEIRVTKSEHASNIYQTGFASDVSYLRPIRVSSLSEGETANGGLRH
jgi:hypothetical protein